MRRVLNRPTARRFAFMPTPTSAKTVLAVVNPFEHSLSGTNAMLVVPPLLQAIRSLEETSRPYRIVSHETDDGRAFNCAYFDGAESYSNYRTWFVKHALTPGGTYYAAHAAAFEEAGSMPSGETWMWGVGQRTLSDTRAGAYQIGMGQRYSRMIFRDAAARAEAEEAVLTPGFEERLSRGMEAAGISYHGRLVMSDESGDGWFTQSRYGSLEDAHRGTALVRMLLHAEMERREGACVEHTHNGALRAKPAGFSIYRWFASYETITGRIASTWLVTPPDRQVGGGS